MLLADYKQVVEIDNAINALHKKLASLYEERTSIVMSTGKQKTTTSHSVKKNSKQTTGKTAVASAPVASETIRASYDELSKTWAKYGIKIPSFADLQEKLAAAQIVMDDLRREYNTRFDLLLIPPSKLFPVPFDEGITESNNIYISPALHDKIKICKEWKLYVAYTEPLAKKVHDYAAFVLRKEYVFSGYEMPGLSIREYAVFLATNNQAVDDNTWSLLMRDADEENGLLPCVAHVGDKYQFQFDSTEALVGQNHFRPAMEIQ